MTQLQGRKLPLLLLRFYSSSHMSTHSRQLQNHNMTCNTFILFIFLCVQMELQHQQHLWCSMALRQRRGDGPICSLINRWNANDPDSSCRLKCRGEGEGGCLCGGRAFVLEPMLKISTTLEYRHLHKWLNYNRMNSFRISYYFYIIF